MNQVYKIITVLLLNVVAITAGAFNITLNVDDPARVKVTVNYQEQTVVAGDNTFDIQAYSPVQIDAKAGALLKSVTRKSDGITEYVSGMSSCSLYPSESSVGETWTVVSVDETEMRTESCRIKADDPTKVMVRRNGTYSEVTLSDGWNTLAYIPGLETQLEIMSKDYSVPLYKVTLGGEDVEPRGNSWYVDLAQNAEIEVFANYPEVSVPVHFTYVDEDAKGFITEVKVNGEPVTSYNDDNFEIKVGSKIEISGNTSDYNLKQFSINGSDVYFYSPYSGVITGETTFYIDAHKYSTIKAVLDIDDPTNVRIYRGYSYNNDLITSLKPGRNDVELSETNAMITIKSESGCYITSVTDGTNTYSEGYDGYSVTLTDGMVLTITTGKIERDKKAVVYIDDRAAATQYFNFGRSDHSSIDMATGYNTVEFYDGDNPMSLSWYGAQYNNVYKNDEKQNPMYDGGTSYEFTFADGDVVKVFLASNPKKYNVTFDVAAGLEGNISVTRDIIKTVDNWQSGFTALQGTRVEIKATGADEIKVEVNNVEIVKTDGTYTFDVNDAAKVKITKNDPTAINSVTAGTGKANGVYTLQGVMIKKNATAEEMTGLPAGIYIVNGRKVIVK